MHNLGYGFKAYPCDVTDFDSARECIEIVTKDVGPVDVLVNNAGITRDMTFKKMTKADWDTVIHTNLDSVFNMTKQVLDKLDLAIRVHSQVEEGTQVFIYKEKS